jgi:hypothetical protein
VLEWIVTKIAVALLMRFGVSSSLAALLAPRAIRILRDVADVASAIKAEGASDLIAADKADTKILRPHRMTPDEEARWMDRQNPHH